MDACEVGLRCELHPGDLGEIVRQHGETYSRDFGFDLSFEAYVAGPLAEFVLRRSDRERIWIAEENDRIVGTIAIVFAAPRTAQLRWFLVDPAMRGRGLGGRLIAEAVDFCRACGYHHVILWTVHSLQHAARLYERAGFRRVETVPARRWGVDLIEERYELALATEAGLPNVDLRTNASGSNGKLA